MLSILSEFNNEKYKLEPGTLYLVATPVGNLADITERALKVLSGVDFIAAEDTRVTGRLLCHFGITKPMISYNEHNAKARGVVISDRLKSGETCALVTDAGTPAVSDPGEELVMLCAELGIPVTAIPGACAAITAVMLSGLPSSRFAFEGSLGETRQKRLERLGELAHDRRMLVIYESPHMLRETLTDINTALGNRRLTLCRELTKPGEEVLRLDVVSAMAYFGQREPRGEYVIVLEGEPEDGGEFWRGLTVAQHVDFYVAKMNISKTDAVKSVARDRGLSKNAVYKELL